MLEKFIPRDARFTLAALRAFTTISTISAGSTIGTVAALELASHLNTPVAEAAGDVHCAGQKGTVSILGLQVWYHDMPGGRPNIFDKGAGEPWVEKPALGGNMIIRYPGAKNSLQNPDFKPQAPKIPGLDNPLLKLNAAFAYAKIPDLICNTDVTLPNGSIVPGINLEVVSSQDPDNKTFVPPIPFNKLQPVWFGRNKKDVAEFLSMEPIRDLDDATRAKLKLSTQEAVQKQENVKKPVDPAFYNATFIGFFRRVWNWDWK